MKDLYNLDNYISVIKAQISNNEDLRGYQSLLASKAGVHSSYFSRVLGEQVHLTPDQAARLANFWDFNPDQIEYFIGLVHFARAATKELKQSISRQLLSIVKRNEDLTKRIEDTAKITDDGFGIYYSTWYFVAIHMLLTLKDYSNVAAVAQRLSLLPETVSFVFNTLERLSLIEKIDSENYQVKESNIHLPNQTYWSGIYHASWRHKIGEILPNNKNLEEIHFTGLNTICRKDFLKIKKRLLLALEEARQLSLESREEDLYCLTLDYFKI